MAPKRGLSIEHTTEHEEFMSKIAEYHEQRGTHLDREPKVGVRHIDLQKLYERVVEEGGYDLCSDTKAKPLMWRKLAEEFVGKNPYTAAQAFQIKNVYYKNLCAYEITTHWKKEPPPKEILEEVTAKGGNVMTRTLENFVPPKTREQEILDNSDASDASPERKTPKEEKPSLAEEPGSGTGRSTRGLRQQPPQRVLFQPETHPARQSRTQQNHTSHASPTPAAIPNGIMNASSLSNGTSSTLNSYEPSQAYPLSLKPVTTPANNPEYYRNERKRKLEAQAGPIAKKYKNIMLPGTGFIGPSIYTRAQLALQSGIVEEEQYALHHLVKISFERGDRYRFDSFPGLADSLIKKVLQITGLFYDVDWAVTYDADALAEEETLNGLHPTRDLHQRLASRISLVTDDSVLDADFLSQLNRITEAALILRNMSLQDENAVHLARTMLLQDMIAVVLILPKHSSVVELRHHTLDLAEQVLRHIDIGTQDALFHGLLLHTFDADRGAVAAAFRTISRIAMNLPLPKRLDNIPLNVLRRAQDYLLVEDEELRSACLDFLTQYTSFSDNVEVLTQVFDSTSLIQQLSKLVLFTAKEVKEPRKTEQALPKDLIAPVPKLSRVLVEDLLKIDEPERSSEWLRMCFIADPNAEMTQISLWQAYQGTFAPHQATHPHLIAGEFIKNVSTTFAGATAQVAGSNKYVIRGIRARKVPVDTGVLAGSKGTDKGKFLHRCTWQVDITVDGGRDPSTGVFSAPQHRVVDCAEWFRTGDDIFQHILESHLHIPVLPKSDVNGDKMDVDSNPSGTPSSLANGTTKPSNGASKRVAFDFKKRDNTVLKCRWAACTRSSSDFEGNKGSRSQFLARHVSTHLPEPEVAKANVTKDAVKEPITGETIKLVMLEDEKGDATGLALRAAVVLRNVARFMPKKSNLTNGFSRNSKRDDKASPMSTLFTSEVRERLFYAMSYSQTMSHYMGSIFRAIRRNDG